MNLFDLLVTDYEKTKKIMNKIDKPNQTIANEILTEIKKGKIKTEIVQILIFCEWVNEIENLTYEEAEYLCDYYFAWNQLSKRQKKKIRKERVKRWSNENTTG